MSDSKKWKCAFSSRLYRDRQARPLDYDGWIFQRALFCKSFVEDAQIVATGFFHRVHGSVGIAEEHFSGAAVLGKNTDSDAQGETGFPATDLDGPGGVTNDMLAAALDLLYGVEFGHHDDKLVSPHARDGIGFANGREQALPHCRQEDVAVCVAKRVVDLFEEVDVNEEDCDSFSVVLRSEDCLAETLMEQRAIGEAGQVIVMREIVDVIGATAMLCNIAAGNGDSVAEADDLDIQPSAPDHLIIDEDFRGIGYPSADNLEILLDEAGFDHEGSNFGEDFAIESFARHA